MKQLQMFNHEKFGGLEILIIDGKENFPANEVAKQLGYSNPSDAVNRHCRKDGVVFHEVIDSLGRTQQKKFISEGNLYRLITNSKLPDAERFEVWVFDVVLPSIRKTGSFSQTKSQAELIAMMAQDNVEKERRLAAVEEKQDNIVSILSLNVVDWRNQVNRIINGIVMKLGGGDYYREIRNESYQLLESRGACNLDIRLQNRHSKMSLKGSSKSAISKVTKLDVIAEDKKLVSVYVTVIKELAVKYQLNLSNYQLNETAGV